MIGKMRQVAPTKTSFISELCGSASAGRLFERGAGRLFHGGYLVVFGKPEFTPTPPAGAGYWCPRCIGKPGTCAKLPGIK